MRAKRTDANHRELVDVLRQMGWLVFDTHALPNFVDAVACRSRDVRLLEFKTADGKFTPAQIALMEAGWPIRVISSIDDAIQLQ